MYVIALLSPVILICTTGIHPSLADEHTHLYDDNEEIVLWMNTVGPSANRQEAYGYFSLPYCTGPKSGINHYHESLGEALQGIELEFSGYDIQFKVNRPPMTICQFDVDNEQLAAFQHAIQNNYWYQMYVDGLPVWGRVGEYEYIFTHQKFEIGYNGRHIVDVKLINERKVELRSGQRISFSYEVMFLASTVSFAYRFDKYLFDHHIHWYSIINSFISLFLWIGLLAVVLLRTLRKDFQRYSRRMNDCECDLYTDYGWKQVHGDVFRVPRCNLLLTILVGNGHQLAVVLLAVIVLTIVQELDTKPGSISLAILIVYLATSPINGLVGSALYARSHQRDSWIRQMFLSTLLIPLIVCSAEFSISTIAIAYQASRAIPPATILVATGMCLFIVLPLNLIGAIVGRSLYGKSYIEPCQINATPRAVPKPHPLLQPSVMILIAGVIPFTSIFIEIYFIFTSFWAYKMYYVYGFMLPVAIVMIVSTISIAIVCTYILLNSENYSWQWTSFLAAASFAIYVFAYSFYYYFFKTKMHGLFQTCSYFAYMILFSSGLGIICGAIGYTGASFFVHRIYSNLKFD